MHSTALDVFLLSLWQGSTVLDVEVVVVEMVDQTGGVDDDDGVDEDTIGHHKTLHTRSSEHGREPYHTCHR